MQGRAKDHLIINNYQAILDGGHTRTVRNLAWNPNGKVLASASFDGTICIWRMTPTSFDLDD